MTRKSQQEQYNNLHVKDEYGIRKDFTLTYYENLDVFSSYMSNKQVKSNKGTLVLKRDPLSPF